MEECVWRRPSSYFPTSCATCGKAFAGGLYGELRQAHVKAIVDKRALALTDDGSMFDEEVLQGDLNIQPGIPERAFFVAGIVSDCCKAEILTYLPFDRWSNFYYEADEQTPLDFGTSTLIKWDRDISAGRSMTFELKTAQ